MIQTIYRALIELTNGKWTSYLLKKLATSKLSRLLIPSFAKIYQLNKQEMEFPLNHYATLHDLFVRKLKADARKINDETNSVISPVDAVIEDIGEIEANNQIIVKGKVYSVSEMIGSDEHLQKYLNGTYMIFYLSPSHYHRIHSPASGKITDHWTLGNKSFPVNKLGLKYGKSPLSKNYRKITEMQHERGHIAIVKVGAMFVNSIELTYEQVQLTKGQEIAYFTFGSTVVLLFEKNTFQVCPLLQVPMNIKVGEKIGHFITK
ncbi:phosphatidylserine decarboxylase [Bacillus aquiflavi]|uniref:Phosphatidylserine decarboxylase proenzyme n=1 Tax=Bacillus aquiflavi TaxID=2672567 RepID=A0A6B3VY58_9BACI|nr:phosphatidylserine decarboxylase [Bacillus aquiflavi]MBA4535909.1 phosphatidylserine decarboxylase [Bacillus aquiflavi]NEY80284.1 phosphatidylserine decarboxylase [Bacillus aquiflavi]